MKLSIDSCQGCFQSFKIDESEEGLADIMCTVQNYKGNPELFFNGKVKYCSSSNYFTEKLGQCHSASLMQEISLQLMKNLSDNIQELNNSKEMLSVLRRICFP